MKILVMLLVGMHLLYGANGDKAYFQMKKEAYYLFEHSQEKRALERVNDFLKNYPQNLRAQNLLAVFHYWLGEKQKAKEILEKIVSKERYAPSVELLAKIKFSEKSESQNKKSQIKVEKKVKLSSKKSIQSALSEDLAFLLDYVKKNPSNIIDRKFLVNYYLSANDLENALKMAKEVLSIDPNDIEMLMLLKKAGVKSATKTKLNDAPSQIRDKAISVLNRYTRNKEFRRFINLYMVLVDKREYLPRYVHMDALNAAVELKEYGLAKKIMLENDFPNTKHLREFRALLDEKLSADFFM